MEQIIYNGDDGGMIITPFTILDQDDKNFYILLNQMRSDYEVIEEHIGVNVIPLSTNGSQIQMKPIYYCLASVKMSREKYISFQARLKLQI